MLIMAVQLLRASLRDRAGISSIEYGVLAAAVIAALVVAMGTFSADLESAYTTLGNAIKAAFTPGT
jgi:Flp pilus assembly pilin Flp